MTESEWLASTDPQAMLRHLEEACIALDFLFPSDRKLRLFAVACCRQVWDLLTDERSRNAVEVAERYADGKAQPAELHRARDGAARKTPWGPAWAVVTPAYDAAIAARNAIRLCQEQCRVLPADQSHLLRDIVGDPWLKYLWVDNVTANQEENNHKNACRNREHSAAQKRHATGLDQGGRAQCLENKIGLVLGTSGGTCGSKRVSDTSHQRRQSRRQAQQPSSDSSGGTFPISRRQIAGEAEGQEISKTDNFLHSMPSGISGASEESNSLLSHLPKGKETGASSQALSSNRKVIRLPKSWLTPTVLAMAQAIYDDRTWEDMPILADALEDEGCNVGKVHEYKDGSSAYWWNDAFPDSSHLTPDRASRHPILEHLRGPGPHVRGCWVIDLLTGRN